MKAGAMLVLASISACLLLCLAWSSLRAQDSSRPVPKTLAEAHEELEVAVMREERLVAALPLGHPLARRRTLALAALAREPGHRRRGQNP